MTSGEAIAAHGLADPTKERTRHVTHPRPADLRSLDGFTTGEGQSLDTPFGHAGEPLHEWMFATRSWHERTGQPGGSGGVDDAFLQLFPSQIGAEIMGAGKFGPPGWHDDPD
jgi:hypothetical protein